MVMLCITKRVHEERVRLVRSGFLLCFLRILNKCRFDELVLYMVIYA